MLKSTISPGVKSFGFEKYTTPWIASAMGQPKPFPTPSPASTPKVEEVETGISEPIPLAQKPYVAIPPPRTGSYKIEGPRFPQKWFIPADRFDDVEDQAAIIAAGGDIEKGEFVGALVIVAVRDLHRIAGILQLDEIDALDHAAGGDVETGNDAFGEAHGER